MKAVKISLELAIVPIRKFLIIFYIYLRFLFGREVERGSKKIDSNMLYHREFAEKHLLSDEKEPARFLMQSDSPVEQFYKRHMGYDHPIP